MHTHLTRAGDVTIVRYTVAINFLNAGLESHAIGMLTRAAILHDASTRSVVDASLAGTRAARRTGRRLLTAIKPMALACLAPCQ
jgi:hypothetical protein